MDSLTQITLGAAVGEVVLGKKLGNRALLWGAIAGTIPDLDVIGNAFMTEIQSLAFHRGISHSLLFAVVFPLLLAFLTQWLYRDRQLHQERWYRLITTGLSVIFIILALFIVNFISYTLGGLYGLGVLLLCTLYLLYKSSYWLVYNYIQKSQPIIDLSWKDWYWLFFWCILTHPILDSFTAYGTQLFAPFSDTRIAFNNISVADPLYTLPYIVFLTAVIMTHRSSKKRRVYNYLALGLSSLYMLFTVYNKYRVDNIMEDTIATRQIEAIRFTTNPSILNNILWSGTIETDSSYLQGSYSFFDKDPIFKLSEIPKNHDLISHAYEDDETINILKWFSDGYYAILRRKDGNLQINDMRYGRFSEERDGEDDYIFRFPISKDSKGYYSLVKAEGGPPPGNEDEIFGQLITRIKGI